MMSDAKLIELFKFYAKMGDSTRLHECEYTQKYDVKEIDGRRRACDHAAWMAAKAIGFVKEAQGFDAERRAIADRFARSGTIMSSGNDGGLRRLAEAGRSKREKAHRWLGFIQGVLWLSGVYTLDELKEHSRKCSDEPDKPETTT
jgi:hypothetical protein